LIPIHDENRPTTRPYVNYGLLLVNVVAFFSFFLQGTRALMVGIVRFGAIPGFIIRGERLWTLLTSMFMHADVMHLLGNMVYLWVFGDNVEDALGHGGYLAFYLLGGLAATFTHIASLFLTLPSLGVTGFLVPTVGASGAISAVLGAYLLLYPRARIRTLVVYVFIRVISVPAYYYLGFWFLYQLMMGVFSLTGLTSGVAFWAHVGGFAAGYGIVRTLGVRTRAEREPVARRRAIRPLAVGSPFTAPSVDVTVEGDRVRVLAELPGMEEGDIEVRVSDWAVVISAGRGERRFYRQVTLPVPVFPRVEDFSYRNGVLSFTLHRRM